MERGRFFDGEQWRLLKQRSVEALLGDRVFLARYAGFVLLLVILVVVLMGLSTFLEAPGGGEDVFARLLVVVLMGAFGVGAGAGAGALVRERVMFVRECGAANLNVAAYLGSKVHSLSLLGIVAVMAYLPVARGVGMSWGEYLGVVPVGWFLIGLLATMACGVCFGLMVSALSRSVLQSQVVVGVLVLGAVLISISASSFSSRVGAVFQWMSPLSWSRASLLEYGSAMPDELLASGYLVPLVWFSVAFMAIAYVFLKRQGYGDLGE